MSGIFDQVINYAPPSLLLGTVTYKGTWSAATNTPTLANPPSSITNGNYYVVSAAGTQFSLSFNIGDWIISNGSAWEKVDNTDAVSSVFGRMGAVVGVSTDYSAVGITNTALGASNPSTVAATTITATSTIAATGAVTGSNLSGTNTGDQTITLTGGVTGSGTGSFAATVVTNANLTGVITSVGNATSIASQTGTGSTFVVSGSPTITTPVIAQINDASGNETLKLASIASAVNEVTIENAATGNAVHISATGGDASVGLHLAGKGASGYVNVQDSVDSTKRILFNASGGTTNTRTMLSSTQTVDRTLSLPDATDTLVGKATTDTLTNKTLTSPTITGGALNGTLGATTPSTVAATTISASATSNTPITMVTTNAISQLSLDTTAGGATDATQISFRRNGTAKWTVGNNVVNTGDAFTIASGGVSYASVSTTGAAITGTLSATDDATITTSSASIKGFYTNNATHGAVLGVNNAGLIRVGSTTNTNVSLVHNGNVIGLVSSTGLAVTGNVSGTGSSNTFGLGGTTNQNDLLILNGSSANLYGPRFRLSRNGTTKWDFGTESGIGGNNSDNFMLYSQSGAVALTANYTTGAITTGAGLAVTGTLSSTGNASVSGTSDKEILVATTSNAYSFLKLNAWGLDRAYLRAEAVNPGAGSGAGSGQLVFQLANNPTMTTVGTWNNTGLAVTGTLSATGLATFTSNYSSTLAGSINMTSNIPLITFQNTGSGANRNFMLANGYSNGGIMTLAISGTAGGAATTILSEWSSTGLAVTGTLSTTDGLFANTTSRSPATNPEYLTVKYDPASRTGIAIQATTNTYATNAILFYGHTSAFAGSIQITATNTIAVVTSSDSRLKKNVREMNDSGSIIDAALPRIFDWNWSDTDEQGRGKDVHGFIAQELHQAFPEAVSVGGDDADKTPWCVDYSKIVPVLVAELKSLRKRLAALEAK